MDLSILQTLGIVDCAVLLRENKSQFRLLDSAGTWLTQLLPNAKLGRTILLEDESIFLNDFLQDAEEFWATHYQGQLKSGIWTEQNNRSILYLEAFAAVHESRYYLIIKNAEQAYHERRQTLQVARELSISNDEVLERHKYLSERLRSILIDSAQTESRLPLHEAIRYANIGVLITDNKLFVQEVNPAAFDIFDLPENRNHDNLLNTIVDLVARQYPEKSIFKSAKHWSGEVFWHTPPTASKWIKVNINSVLSNTGQVSHWIISFSDQTRIKHLLQTNEELALHDSLTGLPNRQYFWQKLQHAIINHETFYLLSIDIINFKNTNELYGYLEGDHLLKQISKRLANKLAKNDFITRIGADEFMIIRRFDDAKMGLNEISFADDTYAFATELVDECSQPCLTQDNQRCDLPIKIGITEFLNDASKAEELLNCADIALSAAKLDAHSSIKFFNEDLKADSNRRLRLETALKNAIENEELELLLQPICDIASGKIVKAEALIRWQFNGQTIMPDEFIPIAENSELINIIGRWVISRACEIIKRLESRNIKLPITFNFSPKQIYDINLISFIRGNIEMMNIDSSMLELEVTEGVLIHNYQKVSTFLHELKRQGLSISVDDFGTGYCSLSYLKHLPIDSLKIDRSFIKDVTKSSNDSAIVSAIIALAQKLNLGIVAEGIETSEQRSFLLDNNCTIGQGYFYSSPVSVDSFEKLIQDSQLEYKDLV